MRHFWPPPHVDGFIVVFRQLIIAFTTRLSKQVTIFIFWLFFCPICTLYITSHSPHLFIFIFSPEVSFKVLFSISPNFPLLVSFYFPSVTKIPWMLSPLLFSSAVTCSFYSSSSSAHWSSEIVSRSATLTWRGSFCGCVRHFMSLQLSSPAFAAKWQLGARFVNQTTSISSFQSQERQSLKKSGLNTCKKFCTRSLQFHRSARKTSVLITCLNGCSLTTCAPLAMSMMQATVRRISILKSSCHFWPGRSLNQPLSRRKFSSNFSCSQKIAFIAKNLFVLPCINSLVCTSTLLCWGPHAPVPGILGRGSCKTRCKLTFCTATVHWYTRPLKVLIPDTKPSPSGPGSLSQTQRSTRAWTVLVLMPMWIGPAQWIKHQGA